MIFTLSFVALSVLGLKYKEVLLLFNCWPEESSYTLSSRWISLASLTVALPKTRLSSAKKRWDTLGPRAEAATPFMAFL